MKTRPRLVKKSKPVDSFHKVQVLDKRDYWSGAEVEEIIKRVAAGEDISDTGEVLDVMVDPDTARLWLNRNKLNRKICQSSVDKYTADMDAGRWLYTHQGIAFDSNGHLIDGQQRLMASSISGSKFPTQVTLNLPIGTGLAVDQGKARTVADIATLLTGEHVSAEAAAVANRMLSSMNSKAYVTRTELVQFLSRYKVHIGLSITLLPKRSPGGKCGPRAVVARALSNTQVDEARVRRFCEILTIGKYDEGPEYGVFLLREWLMKNRVSGTLGLLESYRRTSGALTAFLKDKSVFRLAIPTSEQFKLPGEE